MTKPSFFVAMPLSTTTGPSGLTRSEAAIEAWKKRTRAAKPGALDPKIAARVKEILAAKQKKGKAKPKGKKGPDPAKAKAKAERAKEAAAKKVEREKAKAERTAAQATAKEERAKSKAERVAAQASKQQAQQAKMKQAAAKQKAKAKASAGAAKEKAKVAQTKQAEAAAKVVEKADREQGDLLASVADNPKKLGFRQAGDLERAGLVEKTPDGYQLTEKGKAKIAKRQKDIDAAKTNAGKALDMDDNDTSLLAIKAGARHSKMDASHLDEASRHLHAAGAMCPDCAPDEGDGDEEATKAIKGIMDNPAWYASHECGDVAQACAALQTITMLIQSELSEEDEDAGDVTRLVDAADTLVDFIGSQLSELRGAAKDGARAQGYKGIEITALDDGEEIATVSGSAIKALGDTGLVGGYLVKFGGDGDLSPTRDVFTKATNYGRHTKSDVWVHHRMLPGLGKKQLTNQAELGMDDEGVFVKHLLDLRSAYEAKLYGMVQAGKLGWSSGTAPHLVERKALGDGRHEITQWTLGLDASYTPMPAGGFVVNAGAMKSLLADAGIDLLNAIYIDDSPEAMKADTTRHDGAEVDQSRARRLSIQQRMIHLRETMNGSTS